MMTDTIGSSAIGGDYGSLNQDRQVNELNRDAFLMLLITQLKNQDPLKPMEDADFIAQLAQFSSLEQMQEMNGTLGPFIQSLQPFFQNQIGFAAASWVGRTITAADPDPPKDQDGGLVDPLTDDEGNILVDGAGKEIARTLSAKVDSVEFTQDGPIMKITVTQKVWDASNDSIVEKEVQKRISLSNVISVT